MSDYIKREDVIKTVVDHSPLNAKEAEYIFSGCKSADVVEVVRCKECVFNNDGWCGADHLGSRWIEAEDYCSFGERKER